MTAYQYSGLDIFFNAFSLGLSVSIYLKSLAVSELLQRDSVVEKRSYEITFGLRAGYGQNSKLFSAKDTENAIGEWMKARVEKGEPVVSGHIGQVTMIYPYRNKGSNKEKASVGTEVSVEIISEPSIIFRGELTPKYDSNRSDVEVLDTIRDLALFVGGALSQTRVYYSFLKRQYSVDMKKS
jgi:hypothetical protein